ncbi:GlcG/HbpS family heme-binding protein [Ochrovirga pacifica]|uniref:GlcG/HbpS family heme-binding protein n=1 Tax=Ochrovirga pacifica TaxID=1042376 RepID=UPI0002557F87|nr:heme-binding protein [Ochrovirga pacifica]
MKNVLFVLTNNLSVDLIKQQHRMKIKINSLLILMLSLVTLTQAQTSSELKLNEAEHAITVAKTKAKELGTLVNIAVVDSGANLVAFVRMDKSYLGSIDVAIKKAKTARYFDIDTGKLGELTQPGGIIYNIEHSNGGLITFPGGIPIKDKNDAIIGAVGVSGGTIEQDRAIATAAANAIRNNQ